jgi:hypothetical protein
MATIIAVFVAILLGWVFGRAPSRDSEMLKQVLCRIGVLGESEQQQQQP